MTMARPGKMPGPRRGHEHRLGVEDHAAPRGCRRLDTETEKGEARLEQDDVTHAERGGDQQRAGGVRQQVAEDNPSAARAERLRGAHVGLLPKPQDLAPHQPPGAEPAGRRRSAAPGRRTGTRSQTASTRRSRKSRGIASAASTSRISMASTAPPRYPATSPDHRAEGHREGYSEQGHRRARSGRRSPPGPGRPGSGRRCRTGARGWARGPGR